MPFFFARRRYMPLRLLRHYHSLLITLRYTTHHIRSPLEYNNTIQSAIAMLSLRYFADTPLLLFSALSLRH